MAIIGGTVETLDEIPPHVWKGLPDCLNLRPSAVNQSRIGELLLFFFFSLFHPLITEAINICYDFYDISGKLL